MSNERLSDVKKELKFWQGRRSGSKRKLLSLLGKLVFLCQIIQPGRIFFRRLFSASTKAKCLHHRVKLTRDALEDIHWWLSFVEIWNHKSVFLEDWWTSNVDLQFATDASSMGGYKA